DFQGQLGLEVGGVTVALCLHGSLLLALIVTQPTTLNRCPNSWGHYNVNGSAATGVYGYNASTSGGFGVFGGGGSIAVEGSNDGTDNVGVLGVVSSGTTCAAIEGQDLSSGGYAGYFEGPVSIQGNLTVSGSISAGTKDFRIDDPIDPANKLLTHTSVESPDMKNIYDGVAVLDANGKAWVNMPDYFQALNKDFRYQLTCIGQPALVYIAKTIANNRFQIAGGKPGMKVSWQVTGVRHDAFANAHRDPVEVYKPVSERGKYLYPVELGLSRFKGIAFQREQRMAKRSVMARRINVPKRLETVRAIPAPMPKP
ncbi:MAG TPA: hypothetical protein VKU00_05555, partial [Chthonomonadaceae bacterium]|nr:hypothetical protein [Chthonomonadaceae bacterium]